MDSIRTARRLPSPKAPRQWAAFALPWAVRTQFCSARLVRASKEEQCFAQGKALPKTRRPQDRAEKGLRSSLSFPPCAHQRKSNASHKAKRFQKRAGHRTGPRKVCDHHFPFPRARTKGRAMLRTRLSVSKDVPGHRTGPRKACDHHFPFPHARTKGRAKCFAQGKALPKTRRRISRRRSRSSATLPNDKGRGIAAAPLVRAIGFRLWLSFSPFRGSGTLAASAA